MQLTWPARVRCRVSLGAMTNILKVDEQNTIQQLAAQGWFLRRITRELPVERQTVRRYLRAAAKFATISPPGTTEPVVNSPPISAPGPATGPALVSAALAAAAGRPSGCERHRPQIEAKLELGLSAQRIYHDLVTEVGFACSYQAVKRFVRQQRPQHPEPVWRLEVQPGEDVQVDFGTGAPVVTPEGQRRGPWVTAMTAPTILGVCARSHSPKVH